MASQPQPEEHIRPGGCPSWPRHARTSAQETARIVRAYPSTVLWPLLILGIVLGVGIWGVTRITQLEEKSAKDRAVSLAVDTAAWFRSQILMAAAPVHLMAATVSYNPQYELVSSLFHGLAPTLMAQAPFNATRTLELAPSGIVRDIFPTITGVVGYDIFNSSVTSERDGAVKAVKERELMLIGPIQLRMGGSGVIVRNPVFIEGVDANETFGNPDPPSPICGEPCGYNTTTRTKFWGFVSTLVDLQAIGRAGDSKLSMLESKGYRVEVEALGIAEAGLRRVAASPEPPVNPVEAVIALPNKDWVVRVAPKHGWTSRLHSGLLLGGVVVVAVAVALLLFVTLVSRLRHKMLVEALLPKKLVREGAQGHNHPNCQRAETAADMLLGMVSDLLEGFAPDMRDVLFIRTVLMGNMDVYQPLNLHGHIKGGNLDADVAQSLMQQLVDGPLDPPSKPDPNGYGTDDGAIATVSNRKPSTVGLHNLETIAGTLSFLLSPDGLLGGGESRLSYITRLGSSAGDAVLPPQPMSPCRAMSRQSSSGSISSRMRAKQRRASVSSVIRAFSSTDANTTEHDACTAACVGDEEALGPVATSAHASGDEHPARHSRQGQPQVPRPMSMVATLRPTSSSGLGARFMSFVRGRRGSMDASMFAEGSWDLQKRPSRLGLKLPTREGYSMSPGGAIELVGCTPLDVNAETAAHHGVAVSPRAPIVITEVEQLLGLVDNWQYDTWRLQEATQGHALSVLGFHLIQRAGLIKHFGLSPVKLARLLRQVESGYAPNPYHNATHAADVLQTLHVILHAAQLHVHYLDPLGLLAAYYAAIVHDYGHPGLTSDFLIATSDPLAVRYNDRSPLENHHCAASFSLLLRPELDVLAPLSASERSAFRKQVIELVLVTDMKQHFSTLSHFTTVHRLAAYSQQAAQGGQGSASKLQGGRRSFERQQELMEVVVDGTATLAAVHVAPRPVDDTERLLSLQVALKVADLGHLGEALAVHTRWLDALEEEFFRQGDRERQLGLPISSLFDRAKQGVSKSQVGFYEFAALPLVHALSSAFPGTQPLMACFVANYNHYRKANAAAQETGTATKQASS